LRLGSREAAAPWKLGTGYAVLVRGAALGLIISACVIFLPERFSIVTGFVTLLSGLPLFWLARKFLFGRDWLTFRKGLGFELVGDSGLKLVWFSLAVISLMMIGETLISLLTDQWLESSLAESVPEELLFDPWSAIFLSSLDAIVWAPLVEETAFRGILYPTLRRRLPVFWAAIASALLFSAVHGYSFQGFLTIFWSGFLWAWAYEKSGSLWPGIICHGVSNTLATLSPILMYRL
jgi:membrane protease YdiL (CAAX protease family)